MIMLQIITTFEHKLDINNIHEVDVRNSIFLS